MNWQLADVTLTSRLFLGTALYPSPDSMKKAIGSAQTDVLTVSLRRQNTYPHQHNDFWEWIKTLPCHLLPNTAHCYSAKEAITTAEMAREIFQTHWIKLEVIADTDTLKPNPFGLVDAAKELISQGFEVFPYCTEDLTVCEHLLEVGCRILMPWASPIGSGQGLMNPYGLRLLRKRLPNIPLIIDAGIGKPSDAARAMEMGFDAILLNSAIALSDDPILMATAFRHAILAGRSAYEAGMMPIRDTAHASTPVFGKAWLGEK
jgi:thiazole synthase